MPIRLTSEKKYNFNDITLKIGTTNRLTTDVVYLEGSLYLKPLFEKENYNNEIKILKNYLKSNMRNLISNSIFKKNFLFDIETSTYYYKCNKKSYFKFIFFFRQKDYHSMNNVHKILKEKLEKFINGFLKKITEINFSYSKTKK